MAKRKKIKYVRNRRGCWICTSHSRNRGGYPQIVIDGKLDLISRCIVRARNGGELKDGMCALHTCNTPACIRPSHLYEGTQKDNSEDCRKSTGFKCTAKLTLREVRQIRKEWKTDGHVYGSGRAEKLGKKFGVGSGQIRQIVYNKAWPE